MFKLIVLFREGGRIIKEEVETVDLNSEAIASIEQN